MPRSLWNGTLSVGLINVPVARLTSKAYADERRALIDPKRAKAWGAGVKQLESVHASPRSQHSQKGQQLARPRSQHPPPQPHVLQQPLSQPQAGSSASQDGSAQLVGAHVKSDK